MLLLVLNDADIAYKYRHENKKKSGSHILPLFCILFVVILDMVVQFYFCHS